MSASPARVIDLEDYRRRRATRQESRPEAPVPVVWVPVWVWLPLWPAR